MRKRAGTSCTCNPVRSPEPEDKSIIQILIVKFKLEPKKENQQRAPPFPGQVEIRVFFSTDSRNLSDFLRASMLTTTGKTTKERGEKQSSWKPLYEHRQRLFTRPRESNENATKASQEVATTDCQALQNRG